MDRIRSTIKQCQRCGRDMTAIKQFGKVIRNMINYNDHPALIHLCYHIRENQTGTQHNYIKLFSLINNCLHNQLQIKNTTNNNRRIPDRYKRIGNIFCTTIRKARNKFTQQDHKILQRSLSILGKVTLFKESDFNPNREAEIKIKLLPSTNVHDQTLTQNINSQRTFTQVQQYQISLNWWMHHLYK